MNFKIIQKILLTVSIFYAYAETCPAFAGGETVPSETGGHAVAVVNSAYDTIETYLKIYGIRYTLLEYRDLENESIFGKYSAIFFPCGIGSNVETSVNILSRGTSLQAVFLKDNYRELDKKRICGNIRRFIENGGIGYFSGYSYEFVPDSEDSFRFFDDFPNTGVIGTIDIELGSEMNIFCRRRVLNGFSAHSGWIAIESINDAEILAAGKYQTIKGEKTGPLIAVFNIGSGEAIYTSYHGGRDSEELKRYLVYRTAYRHLLDIVSSEASKWEQDTGGTIIDSVREWEFCRTYAVPLAKGLNTIYFTSDSGLFQMDVLDRDDRLIISKDSREKDFIIDIDSISGDYFILRVYPSSPRMNGVYSIAVASGMRIIPYYVRILYFLLFCLVIFIIFMIRKILGIRRFSGKY